MHTTVDPVLAREADAAAEGQRQLFVDPFPVITELVRSGRVEFHDDPAMAERLRRGGAPLFDDTLTIADATGVSR